MIEQSMLLFAGLLSALCAGLLFGFSVAVMPGLRKLSAKDHIVAMQHINIEIVNPMFLISFMGPTPVLALTAYLYRDQDVFVYLLAAFLLQLIGMVGVTVTGNIPLNDQLETVDVKEINDAQAERIRNDYNGAGARWMMLHHARTIAATISLMLVFWSAGMVF